ncbi:hypothetical protein [Nonomuraea sp. NPDC049784]|uniref:hypothetical protein n=1 Tax=Nonomuraea sp. NPDC049784 TaxID=3154361 RepID=UPI0033DD4636
MTVPARRTAPADSGRSARRRLRHLARLALFAAVRGLGYAVGTTTVSAIVWWITHR